MIDISWAGKIPDNWEYAPLKSQFSFGKGLSITKADLCETGEPVLSYGQIHSKDNDRTCIPNDLLRFVPKAIVDASPDSLAISGGFIFADTSEDLDGCGNCNYVDRDGIYGGYHTVVLKPQDITDNKYLAYLFQTDAWRYQLRKELTEVKLYSVSQKALKSTWVLVPPISERQAIVRYLDSKCSAIDEAIERHKKIIEKLEEYRKRLVTYIVTHGLNNDVPTKNSGVKWFDTVPSHWTVCRSKYVFESGEFGIKVGPFGSALRGKMLGQGPYKVYNQAHLINNDFTLSRHFVSADTFEELSNYKIKTGDILFSVMGTIGKCKQMPDGLQQGIMDSHLIKARLNKRVIPAFFEYVYDKDNSNIVMNQLLYLSQGSIMNGLNSTIISNLYLPVPPVNEQKEIVLWLDARCNTIDNAIMRHKELMTKLEEYRKAIIYHAVTGKIDCRNS